MPKFKLNYSIRTAEGLPPIMFGTAVVEAECSLSAYNEIKKSLSVCHGGADLVIDHGGLNAVKEIPVKEYQVEVSYTYKRTYTVEAESAEEAHVKCNESDVQDYVYYLEDSRGEAIEMESYDIEVLEDATS
jgi:hypothetical protein